MIGLGLAVGAVFHPALSQVVDSTKARVDTTHARRDSRPAAPDTIQPPIAQAFVPKLLESDQILHFDRAAIFASGAINLQDLLSRAIPATTFAAGYVASPANVAVAGDFRRVRLFIDGIEYDALDPRSNGLVDFSQIPIWSAEDISIERTAGEIRVHMRSWRVDRTSPYTRTDIATGDQQLNLYRGFFGRRFSNGVAIQFAAQQYGTSPPTYLGASADQLGIVTRIGWAGKVFSIDGYGTHVSRHRGEIFAYGRIDSLPSVESTRTDAYLRVGYHNADTSVAWAQAVASHASYNFKPGGSSGTTVIVTPTSTDTVRSDTTTAQWQYLLTGGLNRGPFKLAGAARIRRGDSTTLFTPSITATYASRGLLVRSQVEGKNRDSLSRMDISAEYVVGRLRAGAAVDRIVDHDTATGHLTSAGLRAWGGVRLGGLWIDAGVIRRDSAALIAPKAFGDSGVVIDPPATGLTLRASGRIWKALFADVSGVRWGDTVAFYRPQFQTRAEVFLKTSLIERFPQGNFGLLISARHEYRSASLFPINATTTLRASGVHELSSLLEIRIYTAIVSWQVRDAIGTRNYQTPDFLMPRTSNFYGVRWEFWN